PRPVRATGQRLVLGTEIRHELARRVGLHLALDRAVVGKIVGVEEAVEERMHVGREGGHLLERLRALPRAAPREKLRVARAVADVLDDRHALRERAFGGDERGYLALRVDPAIGLGAMLARRKVDTARLEGTSRLLEQAMHDERARSRRVVERVHGQKRYMRSGLRMPSGSKAFFRRRWILATAGCSGWKTPIERSPPRNSVACPPILSAVERTVSTSRSPPAQRSPPPHSMSCAPPVAIGSAVCGTERRQSVRAD